ncbi:hypothetical protein BJF82_15105 [Kytococcus sp. CUA-901]|nr:hypothetical protein BJF82_15105 [Kytococcus sp. CUA-901]
MMKRGRIELTGYPAWVAWLAVHLFYLIGFKNQLATLMHWAVSFVGGDHRGERTVTEQQVYARLAAGVPREDFRRSRGGSRGRSVPHHRQVRDPVLQVVGAAAAETQPGVPLLQVRLGARWTGPGPSRSSPSRSSAAAYP